MIVFQQHGVRRSGTNYIKVLLEQNYSNVIVSDNMVWKHGYYRNPEKSEIKRIPDLDPKLAQKYIKSLIIIKDPYAWIESMFRWAINVPEEKGMKYFFFDIKGSFKIDDYQDSILKSIHSYNNRYKDWISNADEMVKYEDLLENFELPLLKLEKKYNMTRINEDLLDIYGGCDPRPVNHKFMIRDWDYSKYYLNRQYLRNLSKNAINIISENVNWELIGEYGYVRI